MQVSAHDEIGRLSEAFNDMARSLREFRRSEQAKLDRLQRSAQQTFSSLPEAVVVVDMDGTIEVATDAARSVFSLSPGTAMKDVPISGCGSCTTGLSRGHLARRAGTSQRYFSFSCTGKSIFFSPRQCPFWMPSACPPAWC